MAAKLKIESGKGNSAVQIIKQGDTVMAQAERLEFGYSTDTFFQLFELDGSDVADQDLYFKNIDAVLVFVREYIAMAEEMS